MASRPIGSPGRVEKLAASCSPAGRDGSPAWLDLTKEVRTVAGFDIPVALASDAVIEGLKRHGIKSKIAVMEPYYPSIEPRMRGVLGPHGYDIVRFNHMRGKSPASYSILTARDMIEAMRMPALERFKPEMVFISAGFDAHRDDDLGRLGLVEADYAWITQRLIDLAERHAGGRIVSCLEGGYNLGALGRSVAAHVKVLLGA